MMIKIKLFIIIIIACCVSCISVKNEKMQLLESFLGKIIFIPDSAPFYNADEDKYLLISYVDSTDCTPCSLEDLQLLSIYNDKLEAVKTTVLLVIQHSNKEEVRQILSGMNIYMDDKCDRNILNKYKNNDV